MEDEDDDGNFTNWMSSYWGHGGASHGERRTKERKRSFRRPVRSVMDRRASLPCASQLDAMQLKRIHAASQPPSPVLRTKEEKEVRGHSRACRASSDDNHPKPGFPENRITTIPELTESFERRMRFRNKKSDKDDMCLICHEEMRRNSGGGLELHCTHRFHKECLGQWRWKKLVCPTCRLHVIMSHLYWSSAHVKMP